MVVEESGGFKYVYVITDNYPFMFPKYRGATWAPLVEYSGGYTNGPNKGKASQCEASAAAPTDCVDLAGDGGSDPWYDGFNYCSGYAVPNWCDTYGAVDHNGEGAANIKCCVCGGGSTGGYSSGSGSGSGSGGYPVSAVGSDTGGCSGCCGTENYPLDGWCRFSRIENNTMRQIASNAIPTHEHLTTSDVDGLLSQSQVC